MLISANYILKNRNIFHSTKSTYSSKFCAVLPEMFRNCLLICDNFNLKTLFYGQLCCQGQKGADVVEGADVGVVAASASSSRFMNSFRSFARTFWCSIISINFECLAIIELFSFLLALSAFLFAFLAFLHFLLLFVLPFLQAPGTLDISDLCERDEPE